MGIKSIIKKAGGKAADAVAKLAVLSPEQLRDVQEQREQYLSQVPSMDDASAEELTRRLLAASSIEIYNEYLQHIHDMYVPVKREIEYDGAFDASHNIRFFNITKWVTDKKENSLEKLVNVYQVLSDESCNIALVFNRTCDVTNVFLAVVNTNNADDNVDIENYRKRLAEAIRGNFPGAEWNGKNGTGILPCLKNSIPYSVASASNIPGEKSEKFISQTIEKLLDGIVPDARDKEYTIILLATPINDVENRKLHLAELYSALAPYAGWQTNFTYQESSGTNAMATFGLNAGVSAGIQQGQNSSVTNTSGTTDSTGSSESDSTGASTTDSTGTAATDSSSNTETNSTGSSTGSSTADTQNSSQSHGIGSNASHADSSSNSNAAGGSVGTEFGIKFGAVAAGNASTNYKHTWQSGTSDTTGTSISDTLTEGTAKTVTETAGQSTGHSLAETVGKAVTSSTGRAVANSVGKTIANTLGHAVSKSVSTAQGVYNGVNFGGNFGANFARSSNVTATVGKNEGITQSFTNYNIKHTLEILEQQMKRYEQSTALGMWDFAAYVLSEDQNVANNVAHSYLALTQGEQSYMSQTAVNLWRGDMGKDSDDAEEICSYLRELRHPLFGLSPTLTAEDAEFNAYPAVITAATSLSGKELAYSLNFPQKSVAGLPVVECAEFGRNVVSYAADKKADCALRIGNIYHMNHAENTVVQLTKKSLCSHTFVTGSTGAGKSNTVYQILNEALEQNAKFLVIEPAKGEYKHVFGNESDVTVYGTNPYLSKLLRLNPFSFPLGIHIFEHLDRLVEIFNVCWPMYAAMPAVLKNAIEKSYLDCGWDLMKSTNKYGEAIYPTFADVAQNIKTIIDSSEYDAENKGAYKGSLLTRLESLTNGINGMLFTVDEVEPESLFDENAIVDLSRVGSTETKSLIMGMLVLKLQEHRMTSAVKMNTDLRHITVLEEAHNILRRTSFEQSSEGSNLTGKSVEMISNAIAEMRTYGEGFIIVDQAPGLLDMSAIRNTNTKIIMRLPDQSDRELVGRAANLNEDQITELAKLPCGVAAIYQNEWIQPVLCKVDEFKTDKKMYEYSPENDVFREQETQEISQSLLECIMNNEIFRKDNKADIQKLRHLIIKSKLESTIKTDFMEYIESNKENAISSLRKMMYDFLSAEKAIDSSKKCSDLTEWANSVVNALQPSIKNYSKKQINLALALLIYEQTIRDESYNDLYCRFTEVYQAKGGVL